MSEINKHGLSRYIPEDVKRIVRQRCGFGCVICGGAIYQYDHFAPEFSEAKEHNPNGITLLCPTCHQKVTTGKISRDIEIQCVENPKGIKNGISKEFFYLGGGEPILNMGGMSFKSTQIPLIIKGENILSIKKSEENEQILISGKFCDNNGRKILTIIENEWISEIKNVSDITYIGKIFEIKSLSGRVVLRIDHEYPNIFNVRKLDMIYHGYQILVNRGTMSINGVNFMNCNINNGYIGVNLS